MARDASKSSDSGLPLGLSAIQDQLRWMQEESTNLASRITDEASDALADGQRLVVVFSGGSAMIDLTEAELPITAPDVLPPIEDGLEFIGASWSPDGRRLVGHSVYEGGPDGRGKWIYEIDSGEYRQVDERDGLSELLDDRTLLFPTPGGFTTLDIETGEERKELWPQRGASTRPENWSLSSDHRWLYLNRTETQGDVWMLDHD